MDILKRKRGRRFVMTKTVCSYEGRTASTLLVSVFSVISNIRRKDGVEDLAPIRNEASSTNMML